MKIAIITYQVAHQKTQDLISGLLLNGFTDLILYALPFVERKQRPVKYQHRFSKPYELSPKELCINLKLGYKEGSVEELDTYFRRNKFDAILIAGAGLLPENFAKNHKVINAHPGFLPKVKGLDALKWAILNEVAELGVTTHFISEKADEGILIDRKIIPLFKEDSFHSFALRQYQTEIHMLVAAVKQAKELKETVLLSDEKFLATMRMPIRLEEEMMQKFENRRRNSPSVYEV